MRCVGWKKLERGSLMGFADLMMDSGLVLLGCTLHAMNGKRWCSPPGRPQLSPERALMYDDAGKLLYAPVIEFVDKKIRYRWSDEAVKAIEAYLDGKEPATGAGSMSDGMDAKAGQARVST